MSEISLLSIERIAKKNNIRRITRSAVHELRDMIEEEAVNISEDAVRLSKHANRRTIISEDIKLASK